MYPDIHHHLAAQRSAELRREARNWRLAQDARPPRRTSVRSARRRLDVRGQLGWGIVELGLRIAMPKP